MEKLLVTSIFAETIFATKSSLEGRGFNLKERLVSGRVRLETENDKYLKAVAV